MFFLTPPTFHTRILIWLQAIPPLRPWTLITSQPHPIMQVIHSLSLLLLNCLLTPPRTSALEKAMATHSSTLAWKIPWMEEPGRLESMGLLRVGHNWVTSLSLFTFLHWRREWQPTPVFFLENPRDRGVWWAAIYGVTQSWTRLKRLSSSSRTSA